ncbi:hypothetical protein SBV1_410005 [Verrucomicrobia bacterium]|nr:hypothetical protein SBV1_410005 [Verrucomicrobiota bacterium]
MGRAQSGQDLRPEEVYQRLLPSVVTLQVETLTGQHYVATAFLALTDNVAVTSWHVVADARRVAARFADNEFVEVLGLVDNDETNDLALVKLAARNRPRAQLCASNVPIGSRAYVIGAPKGFGFSIADGLVSQLQTVGGVKQYQISCPISGGNSGGPLVNSRGEVIGVTSWREKDAENLNFATPISALLSLNPSQPFTPWEDLGVPGVESARPVEVTTSSVSAESSPWDKRNTILDTTDSREPSAPAGLPSFKEALGGAVGEDVSIIVVRKQGPQSFRFVVPTGLFDHSSNAGKTGAEQDREP